MTSEQYNCVQDAAHLLRIALNPRETVARSAQYQQLLQRFHADAEFRETTRVIAHGLDLQVFELPRDVGIAVVNIADGPYAPNLNDFRSNMKSRDRIVFGLLIAMLAAYVYPSRRALGEVDEKLVVQIELRPLIEWASTTSKQMKEQSDSGDVANEDLRKGFETIALLDQFGDGPDTLQKKFRIVLQWLVEHGMFLNRIEGGKEYWVARPHFRVQARHLMQSAHDRLIETLRARTSGNLNT